MVPIGLAPALALVAGAACGVVAPIPAHPILWGIPLVAGAGGVLWWMGCERASFVAITIAFAVCGATVAADARDKALHSSIRMLLDRALPGFSIDTPWPPGFHDPIAIRIRLTEDAAPAAVATTLRARVVDVRMAGTWRRADGGLIITVGGAVDRHARAEWVAGRTLETPVSFRRPARFLNDGVPDFEQDVALDGTALFASAKSGLLVQVRGRGTAPEEAAARVRQHVRQSVTRWVGTHDPVSAAIVTAVLVGDRTALPDDVRLRLQAAGTYHVIAISGGNIAILAALCLGLLRVLGGAGRIAAAVTLAVLVAYAGLVITSASVWRATLMASLYLVARLLDHRSPSWQALMVTAAIVTCVRPLDVRDVGFILTFGATAALLDVARRMRARPARHRAAQWMLASVASSLAVEAALLPVSAHAFSRVTSAGLVLNLLAVPLMGVVQVAGIVVASCAGVDLLAQPAGWIGHLAARALVDSAGLVDLFPWLSARVPPPQPVVVLAYYVALGVALTSRGRLRVGAACILVTAAAAIGGVVKLPAPPMAEAHLRLTLFDVGQGEAILLQPPQAGAVLVDSGGTPFGSDGFDIGARVLAPALWARGVRRLHALLVTHGDPDHLGGGRSVLADFAPAYAWEGIPVSRHTALQEWIADARTRGIPVVPRLAGEQFSLGRTRVRVLHPPPADWERPRVRNDDSVVMEVVFGEVAMLLTGDISAEIERALLPRLTHARIRILKVAHHGSRTSSSRELLDGWRPQIALISCGRGNTFGHPATEVLSRLDAIGAQVYRTDRHGQITIETDGADVRVRTYVGERK
ncbi:MAG TPA: DNA internalization-related competence protein ComEC/Rec2 [Vicinamibacterales bacterium]